MVSNSNRLKFESEKLFALKAKADAYVVPPKKPARPPVEKSLFSDFSQGPVITENSDPNAKRTSTKINICSCGDPEPVIKGYCKACVTKLKAKFDVLLEKFKLIKEEYDEYNQADVGQVDQKLQLLKNKMA